MNLFKKQTLLAFGLLLILSACGGGGGGDDDGSSATTTSITGLATKGPIDGATIRVYVIDESGQRGAEIGTPTASVNGQFELDIPSDATLPLEIVLVGGSYTDETTSSSVTFGSGDELRSILGSLSDSVVSITPFTHALALQFDRIKQSHPATANSSNYDVVIADAEAALGFSPFSVAAYDPLNLPATVNIKEKTYAALLGGFSALTAPGKDIWVNSGLSQASQKSIVLALIEDMSDGKFDGLDIDGIQISLDNGMGQSVSAPFISADVSALINEANIFAGGSSLAVTLATLPWNLTTPSGASAYTLSGLKRLDGSNFDLTESVSDLQITTELVAWSLEGELQDSLFVHDLKGDLGTTMLVDGATTNLNPFSGANNFQNTSVVNNGEFLVSGSKLVWTQGGATSNFVYDNNSGLAVTANIPTDATINDVRPGGLISSKSGPTLVPSGDPTTLVYFSQDHGITSIEYEIFGANTDFRTCNSQPCFANLLYEGTGKLYSASLSLGPVVYDIPGSPFNVQIDGAFATWSDFNDGKDYVYQHGSGTAPVSVSGLGTRYLNGTYLLNSDTNINGGDRLTQVILAADPTTLQLDPIKRVLFDGADNNDVLFDARTSPDMNGRAYVLWIENSKLMFSDGSSIHTLREGGLMGTRCAIYGNTIVWEEGSFDTLDVGIMYARLIANP